MAPARKIRVALIGLNAPFAGTPTGTNWAAAGHLPYLTSSDRYELVALQNSSAERASKAIEAYGLDPNTVKAYGTPQDIAADPDVDLVVSCIRVDRHLDSLLPAIKAGKDVFVEWPVEANLAKVRELAALAKAHGSRNVVGLQGRYNPLARKLREIIARGDIGQLESSTVVGQAYGGASLPAPIDYFANRKIGGSLHTIIFSHSMEFIMEVLGDISHHRSFLVNQHPTVSIIDPITHQVVDKARPNDSPTHIVLNAMLSSGTALTYTLRGDNASSPTIKAPAGGKPRMPTLDWRIFGTTGQIRVTSYDDMVNTWSLNRDADHLKVEVYNAQTDTLTELDVVEDDFEKLPETARNMARLYEAFASARAGDDVWYPDFDYGVKKHQLIDAMYKENDME